MFYWGIFMFILGVLAFLDSFFNYGEIFRRINSVLFMLLALGVLLRTRLLAGKGKRENLIERNRELENRIVDSIRADMIEEKHAERVN